MERIGSVADARIAAICARQLGLITLDQARGADVTAHQLRHRCRLGTLEITRRGVYRRTDTSPSFEQALLAAVLAAGAGAFASHDSACRLHGLALVGPIALEVTTSDRHRPRQPDVAWHRMSALHAARVELVRGVPACSVERAIADVSARHSLDALAAMIDEAVERGLTSRTRFARVVGTLAPVRVRDRGRLRAALAA